MTTKRYFCEIGFDDEKNVYLANVVSVADNKGTSVEAPSLKLLLAHVSKTIRKRESHNLRFPPPEPGLIISADSSRGPQLIVPARN